MESIEFKRIRAKLKKTQKETAQLIGTSIKAVHSYEQGWRKIPHHVERQMLFLFFRGIHGKNEEIPCWETLNCPDEKRNNCPAWEFKSGDLCWFINGTICSGEAHKNWQDKIAECKKCHLFKAIFQDTDNLSTTGGASKDEDT
ncbi:hypothetical protein SAMN02746065_13617 [Desulfocicer vacuolatum DSM 3385]|uniref:HTH cro/C1-type domain-containing protein n=1 Tax=Desulfocicer vacuolatum DSM 3385 TaxID=1121400 RepID=A0A1W2EP34_9BACT|nr:transcriptional regulator [Desulfocicer vacuolatum]SMD11036.1 hypothetical protein SAMN02746065_13617 [Desulfocicer vacuolatum DSM 3385]